MPSFFNLILIFLHIYILVIFLSLSGYLFRKGFINHKYKQRFEEDGLYGFILIGFVSVLQNFFVPLNLIYNSIIFLIITIVGVKLNFFKNNKKEIIKKSFIVASISFLIIIYSNVNRPDAWLYHLPYSNILNEHKIILGVANIHERFAHISIFQYISSFFYNYLFSYNGLLIPISLVASFFFLFTYNEFKKNIFLKKTTIYSYFNFLILILSLYAFNRYSEYGNDAQSHFFYFFFTILLLRYLLVEKNIDTIKELFLVSIFIFFTKPTFIVVLLIPLFLFLNLKKKKDFLKSKSSMFCSIFFIIWIIKNIFTTGCLVYPLNFTCNDNIFWKVNNLKVNTLINEAWSKGWPDQKEIKTLNKSEFIKDFNWIETWINNHFIFVFEKILPVIIFFIANFLLFYLSKSLKRNLYNKNLIYLFIFNLCFLLLWFLKFPVYRLGISQIFLTITLFFYPIFIRNLDSNKVCSFYRYFNFFIIFVVIVVSSKNLIRIYDNRFNTVMPNIFYNDKNNKQIIKFYDDRNKFTHYMTKNDELCGYFKSPCTHINRNFLIKEIFGYKIYTIN